MVDRRYIFWKDQRHGSWAAHRRGEDKEGDEEEAEVYHRGEVYACGELFAFFYAGAFFVGAAGVASAPVDALGAGSWASTMTAVIGANAEIIQKFNFITCQLKI